jgi:hypothetical protein
MYRVSPETGREEWMAKNVRRFLATSPTKIYTIDRSGHLAVLSAKSGALIDRASIPLFAFPITNRHTDQIILATDTGLIQSLHEIELTQRLEYRPPKKETPEAAPPPKAKTKPAETPAPPAASPPPAPDTPAPMPMPMTDNPFGPADPQPADNAGPFGAR